MAFKSDEKFIRRCELIYFVEDVINKRNLSDEEFFKFIKTRHSNIAGFRNTIVFCREVLSSELANQMKVILNYKLASLNNDEEALKKYSEDFVKIKNIKLHFIGEGSNKTLIKHDYKMLPSYKKSEEKPKLIDKALKSYIDDADEEKAKSILEINPNLSLNEYIKTNISCIEDYEQYIKFYIKYYKLEKININEINEFIIIIKFFLQNLEVTYEKLMVYKTNPSYYEKEIRNMKVDKAEESSEVIRNNINRLCQYKIQRVNKVYESYISLLIYFEELKSFLENPDEIPNVVSHNKLVNIKEDFLIQGYKTVLNALKNYKSLSSINRVNDDNLSKIKSLYLENIIEN